MHHAMDWTTLSLHDLPVIGVGERLAATSVRKVDLKGGAPAGVDSYIFDIGQNIAGVVEHLNAVPLERSTVLWLRHSEEFFTKMEQFSTATAIPSRQGSPCEKGAWTEIVRTKPIDIRAVAKRQSILPQRHGRRALSITGSDTL